MYCRDFRNIFCENQNVKLGKLRKAGGGGLSGVKSGERIVESGRFFDAFSLNSSLLFALHGSVLRWSNFLL
jgi:hypothetical protein